MSSIEIKSEHLPRYEELSKLLRQQIESGKYRPGDQIPTELELVREYDVSRTTIRQAIAMLEEGGYVVRRKKAGTIVQDLCSRGRPIPPLKTVGMMMVDLPEWNDDFWVAQTARLGNDFLSQRGAGLLTGYLSTSELCKGVYPPILKEGFCQAIIMGGWVSDAHCEFLQSLKIPYMAFGNRWLNKSHPQARYDVEKIMEHVVRFAYGLRPNRPIVLFLEPFRLDVTRQTFQGYAQAIAHYPQRRPLLEVHDYADASAEVEANILRAYTKLIDDIKEPFTLITLDYQWMFAFPEYRRKGFNREDYPVFVLGRSEFLNQEERSVCYTVEMSERFLMQAVLPRFLEAYDTGKTGEFFINLDHRTIVSPTGEAIVAKE